MKVFLVLISVLVAGHAQASAVAAPQAEAGRLPALQLTAEANNYPIKPSDAALIAQKAVPNSTVLNVKLLPSGEYAVTLKSGGSVQKVMVNATTGATS